MKINHELQGILDAIHHRRFAPRMKLALNLVLVGDSYRVSAARLELDFRDVYRRACSIPGLRAAHRRNISIAQPGSSGAAST